MGHGVIPSIQFSTATLSPAVFADQAGLFVGTQMNYARFHSRDLLAKMQLTKTVALAGG
jgi:hypothetical protein